MRGCAPLHLCSFTGAFGYRIDLPRYFEQPGTRIFNFLGLAFSGSEEFGRHLARFLGTVRHLRRGGIDARY